MASVSSLFYSSSEECLYARITPTGDQRDYLQEQHGNLAAFLKSRLSTTIPLANETWIQGSYKYGTMLRPFEDEEFDVDLGFYFRWSGLPRAGVTADSLRSAVQRDLEKFAQGNDEVREIHQPPKTRCCRVYFREQFHVDIPVYHLDESRDLRELAVARNRWENSDPKKLYKWIRDRVMPEDYRMLRRIVCYLKAWSRLTIVSTARPASILITVLAVLCYFKLGRDLPSDDDAALVAVVEAMAKTLRQNSRIENPVDPSENLNRLSPDDCALLVSHLDALGRLGKDALAAATSFQAALIWAKAFRYMMPLPVDSTSLIKEAAKASPGSLVVQPDVAVTVTDRGSGRQIAAIRNAFPGALRKDFGLHFRVQNSHQYPPDAIYRWTARNAAGEAADENHLGHENAGVGKITNDERTAYNGSHFMDVQVESQAGAILAFRRIPVTVAGAALKKRYRTSARPRI
jgi:Adenylyl/Guanylyl and SMODS C-terminal sensor domain/Second Messenger Oligonucleotide or Dinucleotide Synthetase domain